MKTRSPFCTHNGTNVCDMSNSARSSVRCQTFRTKIEDGHLSAPHFLKKISLVSLQLRLDFCLGKC